MTAPIRVVFLLLLEVTAFLRMKANLAGPISVANIFEDSHGKLRLNRTALKEILMQPELENKPLVIVSIVGKMRGGKSFFMNFPKRYLSSRGWENRKWIGGPETKANNGFAWKKGIARNTTGIDIWNRVFTMQDTDGEDVAVLLMDTQGLFDRETTLENNMRLFAYSSLASSLQILNFQGLIDELNLQNLQLSAEFARVAADVDESVFLLPELMVLVQNWNDENLYEFGLDGGKKYMKYLLSPQSGLPELNALRQNLRSSFDNMQFYLMPHPGLNVTKVAFTGANAELDEQYLHYVKSFVEIIFEEGNLPIKMWQGKPMTAKELYTFLTSCDDALQSDEMPKVESMGKAFARTHYSNQYDECLKIYEDKITAEVEEKGVIIDADLQNIHDKARQNAISSFDSAKTMGSDDIRHKYRSRLEDEIDQQFQKTIEKMKLKKKDLLHDLEGKCFEQYSSLMTKNLGIGNVDLNACDKTHTFARNEARQSFNEMASVCEPFTSDGKRRLEQRIGESFETQRAKLSKLEAEKRIEEKNRELRMKDEELREARERRGEDCIFRFGPFGLFCF